MRKQRRKGRFLGAVVAAAVLAFVTYAFTASNSVPSSSAGSGANTISGYSATNVVYGLNATNPNNIDSVSFTISPTTAGTVKAQLVSGGSWYSCTNSSGSVSCATTSPQATVSAANQLTVLAVQ